MKAFGLENEILASIYETSTRASTVLFGVDPGGISWCASEPQARAFFEAPVRLATKAPSEVHVVQLILGRCASKIRKPADKPL